MYTCAFQRMDMDQDLTFFVVEAVIQGYHVYKDVWDSSIGEFLACEVEDTNRYDTLLENLVTWQYEKFSRG